MSGQKKMLSQTKKNDVTTRSILGLPNISSSSEFTLPITMLPVAPAVFLEKKFQTKKIEQKIFMKLFSEKYIFSIEILKRFLFFG